MEENEENKVNTDELRTEASNTVNQFKDTLKNADIKKDSMETKGFVVEMFQKPLEKIKEVAEDQNGKNFKYAIIILIVWACINLISRCFAIGWYWRPYNIFDNLISIATSTITPIVAIITLSLIAFFMNNKNKKPLTTVIATLSIAKIPTVIAAAVSLLTIISYKVSTVTSPFSSLCSVISLVLTYFGLKNLYNEEDDSNFLKKFIIIEAIYYIAHILFSFLNIYI